MSAAQQMCGTCAAVPGLPLSICTIWSAAPCAPLWVCGLTQQHMTTTEAGAGCHGGCCGKALNKQKQKGHKLQGLCAPAVGCVVQGSLH